MPHCCFSGDAIVTFDEIQQSLAYFHQLTHLTLVLRGSTKDLGDGRRWETCSSIMGLRDFQFSLEFTHSSQNLSSETIRKMLDRFSTPFWCRQKKWYVIVTSTKIQTISFVDDQLWINPSYLPLSTLAHDDWLFTHTKQVEVDRKTPLHILNKFQSLEQLVLLDDSLLFSFDYLHRFLHLRHLICHRSLSNTVIGKILSHTSHIDRLTLSNIDFRQLSPLYTIRCLCLRNHPPMKHRTQVRALCRAFPCLERLSMFIHCLQLSCPIVNSLEKLGNAVFYLTVKTKSLTPDWFKENTRLGQHSVTYRYERNILLLWIGHTVRFRSTIEALKISLALI